MVNAAGTNLEALILYGSAARQELHEKYSDLNLLCALRSTSVSDLETLAPVVKWWSHKMGQRPPLVLTAEELRESADVFAIEMLDLQASHKVLYGRDVIAGIAVPRNLHRVQVEHELRTVLLKLRQHYVLQSGDGKQLRAVLAKSFSAVRTLLRHALITMGEEVPASTTDLVAKVDEVFGVGASAFDAVQQMRDSASGAPDLRGTYQAYLEALSRIVHELDHRLPKREWQRTQTAHK
jgi:hypothetical protein